MAVSHSRPRNFPRLLTQLTCKHWREIPENIIYNILPLSVTQYYGLRKGETAITAEAGWLVAKFRSLSRCLFSQEMSVSVGAGLSKCFYFLSMDYS